jgi:hypothetical protein
VGAPAVLWITGGGVVIVGGAGLGYYLYKRHRAASDAMPIGVISYSATKPASDMLPAILHPTALHPIRLVPKLAPAPKPAVAKKWTPGDEMIQTGVTLKQGDSRVSQSNAIALLFEPGALSLYDTRGGRKNLLWSTGNRPGADHATMQHDGNFVLYDVTNKPLWAANVWAGDNQFVRLQDDGNMVIYDRDMHPHWDVNTYQFVPRGSTGDSRKVGDNGFNVGEIIAIGLGVPPGVFTAVATADPAVDSWTRDAVKTAGRDIGQVAADIQDVSSSISDALEHVPFVGPLLHGLYDGVFMLTLGPAMMTEQVIVEGQGIDQVVLAQLKAQLQDFKDVGPYAEMVCSLIPGVGTGIAAAIGVGLALANGQGIAEAILAGVEAAVPGGPLAKMAFDVAQKSIVAAVEGKELNWGLVASTAVEVTADVVDIPVPDSVKKMLEGGMACTAMLVQGKRVDAALATGFADALPVAGSVKSAIVSLTTISVNLANGQKLDQAILNSASSKVAQLPVSAATKQSITAGVAPGTSAMHGDWFGYDDPSEFAGDPAPPPEFVLSQRIQHAVTDIFLDRGKAGLNNQKAADAINIAIGMQQGKILQDKAAPQFAVGGPVMTQLLAKGKLLLQTDPVVAGAYKTLTSGQTGFLVGAAVMRYQINTHQFCALRDNFSGPDQKGYDTAASLHIARVAVPAATGGGAAYLITRGLQGAKPQQKAPIMQALIADKAMQGGTVQAVKTIHAIASPGMLTRIARLLKL